MKKILLHAAIVFLVAVSFSACRYERPSLWEMKCAACHDGQTVINEKVMPGKEELKSRSRDIDEFVSSCLKAPRCMNILNHDEELFIEVGREIGIPYAG